MKAVLGLEDGEYITGEGFGVEGSCAGELVFTTQMTGYMEALTDPSYAGQILMFTYPLVGNYGVDEQNFQSPSVKALGCVMREICENPAALPGMKPYCEDHGMLGISGVDTRRLTIKTRLHGTLRASLIVGDDDGEYAVECARNVKPITELDLISRVSCTAPYRIEGKGKRIAIIDLGIKKNMILSLRRRGADLYLFPHDVRHDEIEACKPDALFLTNGPGDPRMAHAAIECVKRSMGQLPIYGICMGNQIAALAFGAETYKMKFGHRGSNQPVRHRGGQIYITTQNHGFAVDGDSLPEDCEIEYINLNDGSVEGFSSRYHDVITVQFHPEAHGGPRDTEQPFFDMIYRRIP